MRLRTCSSPNARIRNWMALLATISIIFILAACASSPAPIKLASLTAAEQMDGVNKVWSEQVKMCVDTMDKLDRKSLNSNKAKLAIAVLGTLSGSVFSQLAKGSGKDAWSGLSGSTNALQSALDENFSSSLMLSEALAIATAVTEVNKKFIQETDSNVKLQIAYSLPMSCRLARLTAINGANRAVSQSSVDVLSEVRTSFQ